MAYQALYRQWRPQDFSHMVGQESIMVTLRHQVETKRIAHAYLFCGSRGTGKTSTAKILARAINCLNPQNGDPCGECETCQRMRSEDYMDILEFDAASNSRVEDARDLLEKAVFPPQFGSYKVYIIDEVHMLSNSAFNALLKTLEEPPEYLVFILATTEPYKLPATILSRCQRFDFGRIPASQIQKRLLEAVQGAGGEATDGALMAIARAAEGGMRDALSILDMCLGYGRKIDEALVQDVLGSSDLSFMFRFSHALKSENAAETILLIDELISQGKDPLIFSRNLCTHLRNLALAKCCKEDIFEALGLTEEDGKEYIRESSDFPLSRIMEMTDHFLRLESDLRYASSPRIALENVSLKCCLRTKEVDTLALNDRIAELESKISLLQNQLSQGSFAFSENSEAKPVLEKHNSEDRKKAVAKPARSAKLKPAEGLAPEQIWQSALKQLKGSEPGTHGMFSMGQFLGCNGTEFQWKANPGFDVVAQSLNSPSKKTIIEEALHSFAGVPCSFIALDSSSDSRQKEEASDEAYLQELYRTFGEEPIDVVDDLPK